MRLWPAGIPEPPIGIEPMTYALRGACSRAAHALAALIARVNGTDGTDGTGGAGITRRPGPRTGPRPRPCVHAILLLCVNVADDMDPRPQADTAPGPAVDLYAATHAVRLADARICRIECVACAYGYRLAGILTCGWRGGLIVIGHGGGVPGIDITSQGYALRAGVSERRLILGVPRPEQARLAMIGRWLRSRGGTSALR